MDPYKILGVAPDASDEQIKLAYRELARKYHPDNYANNPLADLAQEKMKQINEAYDTIQKQRKSAQSSSQYSRSNSQSYSYGGSYQSSNANSSQFIDIRNLFNQRKYIEAEELLDGVPANIRSAEWYFLKGKLFYVRGWLDEAYRYFAKACQLEPHNMEFQTALQQLSWQRGSGRPAGYGYSGGYMRQNDMCDICNTLICADCLCECLGGDLINCC